MFNCFVFHVELFRVLRVRVRGYGVRVLGLRVARLVLWVCVRSENAGAEKEPTGNSTFRRHCLFFIILPCNFAITWFTRLDTYQTKLLGVRVRTGGEGRGKGKGEGEASTHKTS